MQGRNEGTSTFSAGSYTGPDFSSPGALTGRWAPGLIPGISGAQTQGQLAQPVPSGSRAPRFSPTMSQHPYSTPSGSNPTPMITQHPYPIPSNSDIPHPMPTNAYPYPPTDFLSSFPQIVHDDTPTPSGSRTFAPPADIPMTHHRPNLSGPNTQPFISAHGTKTGLLAPHFVPSGTKSLPDISRWGPEPPLTSAPQIPTKSQWKATLAIAIVTYLTTYILISPGVHKWRASPKELANAHVALKAVNQDSSGSESSK